MTTAASHPNLDVVNAVYEAMAAGDQSALERLHHPDVVLHVSGTGPHAGDYVGRDEVLGVAAAAGRRAGGDGATTTVHDVLWSPEHVVVLLSVTVERDGDALEQRIVQVVHVEGAQVVEVWEYLWDQDADQVWWSRH